VCGKPKLCFGEFSEDFFVSLSLSLSLSVCVCVCVCVYVCVRDKFSHIAQIGLELMVNPFLGSSEHWA